MLRNYLGNWRIYILLRLKEMLFCIDGGFHIFIVIFNWRSFGNCFKGLGRVIDVMHMMLTR
jgi:hypothetical protein